MRPQDPFDHDFDFGSRTFSNGPVDGCAATAGFIMLKSGIAKRDPQHARARALPYHNRAIATQEVIEELIPHSQGPRRGQASSLKR